MKTSTACDEVEGRSKKTGVARQFQRLGHFIANDHPDYVLTIAAAPVAGARPLSTVSPLELLKRFPSQYANEELREESFQSSVWASLPTELSQGDSSSVTSTKACVMTSRLLGVLVLAAVVLLLPYVVLLAVQDTAVAHPGPVEAPGATHSASPIERTSSVFRLIRISSTR